MSKHNSNIRQQLDALREQLQHATQAVAEAQGAVEADLLSAKPTTPARERLAACIQRHRELEQLLETIQQRLNRDQSAAADRRAAELSAEIDARIQQFLDKFPIATLPETAA